MIRLADKILDKLNIKIQRNQGWLVISEIMSGLLYSLTCIAMQKEFMIALPAQYLSIEAIWMCLSSVIVGYLWKGKLRATAIKNYTVIALTESLLSFFLSLYLVFIHYNVWIFAIASALYVSIITMFVGKCKMMFEANLWKAKEREQYDNTSSLVRNIVAVCGFGLAAIIVPPLKWAILLWGIGCVFDDIGWLVVYRRCKSEILASGEA